jgi:glycosyltransferase involved in cell wall biosynthesis
MRILLWHGWLLAGSGSNVYTARIAAVYRRQGHDVALVCQEGHPERFPFIDAWGTAGAGGVSTLTPTGVAPAPGRVALIWPEIGSLLPVFVYDDYEGFEVKRFIDLTEEELDRYLGANVDALRAIAEMHRPEVVIVGHAVAGPAIARRALGNGALVKMHGSDLEYAVRLQERYRALAEEGLEAARAVVGTSSDVLARTARAVPSIRDRVRIVAPGVEVEHFRLRPRREALLEVATMLERDPDVDRGRPDDVDRLMEAELDGGDATGLDAIAAGYDQNAPDRGAPGVLRSLAATRGPIVGYLGKFIPQKGVELLLQALGLQPSRVRGLIVGFGTYRERLTALLAALDAGSVDRVQWLERHSAMSIELGDEEVRRAGGLRTRVAFSGRLDHRYAPLALAAMDVLVVPSILDEAFGMVSTEGAAAGALPLVARHSGLAEVAAALEGAVGMLGAFSFEPGPGAAHRISAGLDLLLGLPVGRRRELGAEVSRFVSDHWTWDRTAEGLLEAWRA